MEENKISINNYHSKSYDNAAAMDEVSGKIQQNTLAVNPKFINCKNYRHTTCIHARKLQTIVILFGCSWEMFFLFLSSISHLSFGLWNDNVVQDGVPAMIMWKQSTKRLEHLLEGEFSKETKFDVGSLLDYIQ